MVHVVQTHIERVRVHPNGALVTRVGVAREGPNRVAGLPLIFRSDTLRARPVEGCVSGLEEICLIERHGGEASTSDLQRRRDGLGLDLASDRQRLERAEARRLMLNALGPSEPDRGASTTSADGIIALNDIAEARLADVHSAIETLTERIRETHRALTRIEAELSKDPAPPRFSRGLQFELQEAGSTRVEFEYFVAAARWAPTYALALEGDSGRLRIDALVAQATGEDWTNAQIAFATSDLSRRITRPELTSWRIGTAQAKRRPAWRPPPSGLEVLFDGYDAITPARESMAPPEAVECEIDDWDDAEACGADEWCDAPVFGSAEMAPPMPVPTPAAPPMRSVLGAAKSARIAAPAPIEHKRRGGLGGPVPEGAQIAPPDGDGPTRHRHGWLQLTAADGAERGRLRPVDPLRHLELLAGGNDIEGIEALHRAVEALQAERDRVDRQVPPPGTTLANGTEHHHVYTAKGPRTVPADGSWHRVVVDHREATIRTEHRAVPRESFDVFRCCTVQLPDDVPLLAGPVQIYVDGRFKVSSQLEGAGGGKIELNLGLEPAVRIIERRVEIKQSDKGMISQSTVVEHSVRFKLRNGLAEPIKARIFDRLPFPAEGEDDIGVVVVDSDTPPMIDHQGPRSEWVENGLNWAFDVPAGQAVEWRFEYTIKLPAKLELQGGNRRE